MASYKINTRNNKSIHEFIDNLFIKHAKVLPVRIDLGYITNTTFCERYGEYLSIDDYDYINQNTLPHAYLNQDTILNYWGQFLNKLRWNKRSFLHEMIGYVWKIEYGYDKGIHYHLIIFFNGNRVMNDYYYAQELGKLWQDITQGYGIYYNCSINKNENYGRYNALKVTHRHDDRSNMYQMISYLTKADETDSLARGLSAGKLFGKSVTK